MISNKPLSPRWVHSFIHWTELAVVGTPIQRWRTKYLPSSSTKSSLMCGTKQAPSQGMVSGDTLIQVLWTDLFKVWGSEINIDWWIRACILEKIKFKINGWFILLKSSHCFLKANKPEKLMLLSLKKNKMKYNNCQLENSTPQGDYSCIANRQSC